MGRLADVLRVGLTGGIGSGKSTVARRLVQLGAVLIDADVIAREVVARGTPGFDAVVAEFGPSVVAADGSLDRPALGRMIFADDNRRAALNSIVHPLVYQRRSELFAAAAADAVVVEDVPLLVENQLGAEYHLVAVVHAPAEERVRRLTSGTRGMAAEDAWARVQAQASDDERRAAADVWLDNSTSEDKLDTAVDRLWKERLVPFEANVRNRSPVRLTGAPEIVPYDPTWPVQAERLMARVMRAVGDRGLRVDHVGSTSVPGIRAKDVIDLQLSVRSLDDADAVRDDLQDAGFPNLPGFYDSPKPSDPDPAHWQKRLHVSADPGRTVHLHVRELGSPGWRYALLFRDWLRASPDEVAAYEAEKARLASVHSTPGEYAEAKEPWFDAALSRADAWATQTGWSPH